MGLIISSTMMNIIQGAVKSVIVCYADHPHRLYENHPEGTTQLTNAISSAYEDVVVPIFNNVTVWI